MNFTDYTSLQSAIADELNRTDLVSAVPGFIRLMEAQTERQLRTREMTVVLPSFAVGNEFEPIPADLLEVRSFRLNTDQVQPLDFATFEQMADYRQEYPGIGMPSKFSVVGEQFWFLRVPDTAYTANLIYYAGLPKLSNTQTTNWLLTKHPDIYFYGSLLNSAPYLKEDARLAVWAQLYQNAVEALKTADQRAQTAANGLKAQARMF